MGDKPIKTFSENIRHMFTKYAIIPVFIITLACTALFFFIWQYTIYKSNINGNEAVSNQVKETINDYSISVNSLSKNTDLFKEEISVDQLVGIRRDMYSLNLKTGYDSDLYLYDMNFDSLLADGNNETDIKREHLQSNWGIFREINDNPQNISVKLISNESKILCIGRGVVDKGDLLGYILITIDMEEFQKILSTVTPQVMITDNNGWVYLSNNYIFQDGLGRLDRELIYKSGYIQYQDHLYYISYNSILEDELYIYSFTDYEFQANMFLIIGIIILAIFLGITLMIYLISGKVTQKTTQDVVEIAKVFEETREGNLEGHLSVNSSLEFKEIGDSYNGMVDGLKKYIKENRELAEHAAFAQVKQLEAQFNPHFLFNTLDNIRFMAKLDPDAADKMIVALSKLLRYSINDAKERSTVEDDIKQTENYLTILKLRFNKRFSYEISIEDKIKQYRIPKLMIQPLIENAVKHGYGDKDVLNVSIRGYEKKGDLYFICSDDGIGIEPELLKSIQSNLRSSENNTNNYGIYNIHRRIQLMYHGNYGLNIKSRVGQGTIVTLVLPVDLEE